MKESKVKRPLDPYLHLCPIYADDSIVVVDKPSGVLSVPGPRRNPNIAKLVQTYYHCGNDTDYELDRMIVHRLDMDTSGIVVFAKTTQALQSLHEDFRPSTKSVHKEYEALVCGHMILPHQSMEGEIDLPLQRDPTSPPFMCVATPANKYNENNHISLSSSSTNHSTSQQQQQQYHKRYHKMMSKAPKPSLTYYQILSYEYLPNNDNDDNNNDNNDNRRKLPVARLKLIPMTRCTHQLRVHCASIGYPIVGDDIYGHN